MYHQYYHNVDTLNQHPLVSHEAPPLEPPGVQQPMGCSLSPPLLLPSQCPSPPLCCLSSSGPRFSNLEKPRQKTVCISPRTCYRYLPPEIRNCRSPTFFIPFLTSHPLQVSDTRICQDVKEFMKIGAALVFSCRQPFLLGGRLWGIDLCS